MTQDGRARAFRNDQAREAAASDDELAVIHRKALPDLGGAAGHGGPLKLPDGGGASLGGEVRTSMERELGADLSAARIHTGAASESAAAALGAHAFTNGPDIHFGAGQYAPGSKEGDRLLAHELTHVVQGQSAGIQRKAELGAESLVEEVSQPHEPAEVEADHVGDRVADRLHGGRSAVDIGRDAAADRPAIRAPLRGTGLKIMRAAEKQGLWSRIKGAFGGKQEEVAPTGPPQVEKLDPSVYKPREGESIGGTAKKVVLVDDKGTRYLFKPIANEVAHTEGEGLGIEAGQYARRSMASTSVAGKLGFETPGVRMVEYEGVVGSLQAWRLGGKTLAQIRDEDGQEAMESVTRQPEYMKARMELDTFDYLINNLDRNIGNFIIDFDAKGRVKKLVPIDHDLTFTKTADRPPVDAWHAGLPPVYTTAMQKNIRHMHANRGALQQALQFLLEPDEIAGMFHRLDVIVADVDAKHGKK